MIWNHRRSQTAECLIKLSNDSELTVAALRASVSDGPSTLRINASRAWSRKPHRASRSVAVEKATLMPHTVPW
jgi:hypothetical protein